MITPEEIAGALLERTCHDVCALVCVSEAGEALSVTLFDPLYFDPPKRYPKHTSQIWLIANRECGNTNMQEYEWRHLNAVIRSARGKRVRCFLSSEYWPCREISLSVGDAV